MQQREIGKSGIKASVVGLGTFAMGGGKWWGEQSVDDAIETIIKSVDEGINILDTAPIYGLGQSEQIVGLALKHIPRDKIIVSTKCGHWWSDARGSYVGTQFYDTPMWRAVDRSTIRKELERSLIRLNTDYIDIYYVHAQAREPVLTPIEETMSCLMELKKEGKIRAIGASNTKLYHLEEYVKYGQLDIIQEKYTMLNRNIEETHVPFCIKNNISIQTYSPLENGLLTGRFSKDTPLKEGEFRTKNPLFAQEKIVKICEMLDNWKDLCHKYNCPLSNLAIAWTNAQPGITNVLCGARNPKYVKENAAGGNIVLEEEDIKRLSKDVEKYTV